jgi:hypothetical protein
MTENVDFFVLYDDPHENASHTDDNTADFRGKKFIVAEKPMKTTARNFAKTAFKLYMGPTSKQEAEAMRLICYPDVSREQARRHPRDHFPGAFGGRDLHLPERL